MSIEVLEECALCGYLVDKCLHIRQTRQTQRVPENVNRANMGSVGGGTVRDSQYGTMLLMEGTTGTAGAV